MINTWDYVRTGKVRFGSGLHRMGLQNLSLMQCTEPIPKIEQRPPPKLQGKINWHFKKNRTIKIAALESWYIQYAAISFPAIGAKKAARFTAALSKCERTPNLISKKGISSRNPFINISSPFIWVTSQSEIRPLVQWKHRSMSCLFPHLPG